MNNIQKSFKTKSSLRDMAPPKMPLEQGGMVHGKGGPKDDLVGPVALSAGEYVLPADTVEIVGRENLEALRLATHDFGDGRPAPKGLRGMQAGGPVQKPKPKPFAPGPSPFSAPGPAPGPAPLVTAPQSVNPLGAPSPFTGLPTRSAAPAPSPVTTPPAVPDPRAPPVNTATMPPRSVVPPAVPAPGAPQAPGNLWDGLRPPSMPSSPLLGPGPGAPQAPASPSSPTPGGGGGIPTVPGGPGAPASGESLLRAQLQQNANMRLVQEQANLAAAKADEARAEAIKKSRMYTQSSAGFKDGGMIRAMKDGGSRDEDEPTTGQKAAVVAGTAVATTAAMAAAEKMARDSALRKAALGSAAPGATRPPVQPVGSLGSGVPPVVTGAATPAATPPAATPPAATPPAAAPPTNVAGRAGSMLRGAATGAGKLMMPLALMGSAAKTYNTPTEQYAARFGVDPRAPEGITPGREFFRDHLLRTAGATSDLAVNAVDAVPGLWNMFAPENRRLPMLGNWVAEREAANGYAPPPPKAAAEEEWVDEPASAEEMARRQAVVDSFSEPEAAPSSAAPSPLRGAGYAEIGGKRYEYNPDTQGFGVTAENLPLRTRAEHAKTASEIIPTRPEPTAAAGEPLSPTQEANARFDAMARHLAQSGLRGGPEYANAMLNLEQRRNDALQNIAVAQAREDALIDQQNAANAKRDAGLGDEFNETIDRIAEFESVDFEGKVDRERKKQISDLLSKRLPPEDRKLLMQMDGPSRETALRYYLKFSEAQQIEPGVDRGAQVSRTIAGALPGLAAVLSTPLHKNPNILRAGLATVIGGGTYAGYTTPSRSNSMQHDEAATRFNPDTGREEQLPQKFSIERAMEVGPIDALTNWNDEVVSNNGRALRRLTGAGAEAKSQYDKMLADLRGRK